MNRPPCPVVGCEAVGPEADHHWDEIDSAWVLQVAAEYGDDHGTCEATLTATQCYSAPLTGPVGFWENAEALADHIERGT